MTIIKGTIHVPTIENPQSESDYDVVYPKTTIDQVIDLADKLNTGITASDDFTITAGENVLSAGSNGALQWQGKNIVRSVNGNEADTSGEVTLPEATTSAAGLMSATDKGRVDNNYIASSDSNYIRYSNGLQICWGTIIAPVLKGYSSGAVTVTLPMFFKDTNYSFVATQSTDGGNTWHFGINNVSKTTTNAAVSFRNGHTDTNYQGSQYAYVTIGQWK